MAEDKSDGPQHGERVPYVIVRGAPSTRLVDRAVAPKELLNNRLISLLYHRLNMLTKES